MTSKDSFRSLSISTILPLVLLVSRARIGTAAERAKTAAENEAKQRAAASYVKLPLSFEINQGQTDSQVKFLSRGRGYALFLTGSEAVLSLRKPGGQPARNRGPKSLPRGPQSEPNAPAVLHLELVGANPAARVTGLEELPGKSNYFIGNDPKKWRTNVPTFAKVKYENIYPGVDLVYYGNPSADGQLEYDFVVSPGGDPNAIKLNVAAGLSPQTQDRGAKPPLKIDANNDLVVQADGGEVRFQKPVVYQPTGSDPERQIQNRKLLDGRYVLLAGNRVAFQIPNYDNTKPLVIDPALIYSTYLGGSGTDWGLAIAVDSSGNAYVTGDTDSSDFPLAEAYQTTLGATGAINAFVAKLSWSGTSLSLVYSTYLGGTGADYGYDIAVDSSGDAYVVGSTYSKNFPTSNEVAGFVSGEGGFVTELNPTGSDLVYSTYLGGSSDMAQGIAVDSSGNAYVIGTSSASDFPTTDGAYQTMLGATGATNAVVAKLNWNGSSLSRVYSTYLGGSVVDDGFGIAVDASGNAYVTGSTMSKDFPTTSGAYQTQLAAGATSNAFVAKLNSAGSAPLVYSTYLGGSNVDGGYRIRVDSSGDAYVTGGTRSGDFPTTKGAFQTQLATGATSNAFVAKLNSTGSAPVYSTYLGGSDGDWAWGLAVDSAGHAYVAGGTSATNFPTTANAPQPSNAGGGDAFVTELNSSGSALVYSTYLGGSGLDVGYGVAVDTSGNAYVTGYTASTNFPTANPYQGSLGGIGATNAFVAEIPAFWVSLSQTSLTFGSQDVGTTTSSQTLTLTNTGTGTMSVNITTTPGFSETDNCGTSLAAGASCTITITSTPTDVGTQTGQLIISGAPSGPVVVSLTVQGILTPGNIATLAGGGTNSTVALSAYVAAPNSTAIDKAGNIYVSLEQLDQVYKITPSGSFILVAGTTVGGFSGDGGPATSATLSAPGAVAVDASGNLYIADRYNYRIREVNVSTGIITTVAGNGVPGYSVNGTSATSASLNAPSGLAIDANGNLFIADAGNNRIRVVNTQGSTITVEGVTIPAGCIATVAGNGSAGYSGDGGLATSATLNMGGYRSQQIALDSSGNLYIADTNNNVIRRVAGGTITTVAGTGTQGLYGDGGLATSAYLAAPEGVAVDAAGNIFFGDNWSRIRVVNTQTTPIAVAGVKIQPGDIETVAGAFGGFGGDGGPATSAGFASPTGVAIDASGDILIADLVNNRVRIVAASSGIVTTLAGGGSGGDGGLATSAVAASPIADALDNSGDLYFLEATGNRVRRVDGSSGIITTVAGNTTGGFNGDGGAATSASLDSPYGMALDSSGNIFIADSYNWRIRRVDALTGIITTVAGNGSAGFSGDGSPATLAQLDVPFAVAVDAAGNLFIADWGNNRVRVVNMQGTEITVAGVTIGAGDIATVAGNATAGYSGDGVLATSTSLNSPAGVAVDGFDNLFIADAGNQRIRRVDAKTGYITTFAGNGTAGFSGDGGPATSASLSLSIWNSGISLDSAGNLFIPDSGNERIRRVDAATGIITTDAGGGPWLLPSIGDGGPALSASLNNPAGVAVDSLGHLFIADNGNNRIREVILAPAVTVSTTSLSFGDQVVGATSPAQTVTVTNSGGGNLSIASIAASGDYAQANTCPATLNPGSTCTISVTFTPTAISSRTGALTITDNSNGVAGSTQTVDLSGTGVVASTTGPAVSLAPASLSFPATPWSLGVTLTNSGASALTIYSIVTSSTSGDYKQTNTCPMSTTNSTLAAMASCSITVTFTPSSVAGSDLGMLTITDNAGTGTQSVPLAATYTTPPQPVSPGTTTTFTNGTIMSETVALPSDAVMNGTASKEVSFIPMSPAAFSSTRLPGTLQYPNWSGGITPIPAQTTCTVITSTGGNCIVIRDLCYDSNGNLIACDIVAPTTPIQLTAEYQTPSSPVCPGYIIADDNQTDWAIITNQYSPSDTGIGGGTKTLNTDTAVVDLGAANCVTSITGPGVSLAPASLVFQAPNSSLSVTLTNTGVLPLTISNIGTSSTSGDYTQANNCPIPSETLAPQTSCSISVTFTTPTVAGTDPGMLTITDNAGTGTQSVPLAATYTTPTQQVSQGTTTTFTNGTIMSETVMLPPDVDMGATASKAVSFIPMSPAAFSSTRLPPTTQSPNWSGGITPIPAQTTCTVITSTGGNCIVIRDLCYDSNGNLIACDIVAPTIPIQLTAQYQTPSSPACPGYIIADDNQTDWAIITNEYSPSDTGIGGGTKTLNTDTAVVDLGAGNCASATLTITASSGSMTYGGTAPFIDPSYSGFVSGQVPSNLTTPPTCSTFATSSSPAGTYPSICWGAVDSSYTIWYVEGTVTVNKATPVVTWATPAAITYGTALSATQLDATANVAGTFAYTPAAGTVLRAGNQTLSVTFTPTDTTDYTTATTTVTLVVNPATPVITWTPAPLELGYPLGGTQLDATANVPGAFVYTPPLGTVITTTSQTLSVVFTPNDTVDYTTASMSVSLTVTPGPLASVSPSSINFGTVYLGSITVKSVTVSNVGNAPMKITTPFFSILSGGTLSEFVAVNLCPSSLAAGKSCTMEVSFIAGPYYSQQTATLSVADSAYSSPQTVTLFALVINPQASLSATSLSFGTQKVGTSSAAKAVTLKSTGATALAITSIAIAGKNSGDFSESSTCPVSPAGTVPAATLAAGSSCTISVTFTPTAKGSRSASVVITDNALSSPQTISLSGTGD